MSPELDWTIEYETLPPDEPPLFEPPPSPRRRAPRWLWGLVALLVVVGTTLYVLHFMGGRIDPRPEPEPDTDPLQAGLESVVALEIRALNAGDREIYDAVQDAESRRRNPQPAPDEWFASFALPDGPAGAVELAGIQTLDENSAAAEVKLVWQGTPYRLYWYYRLHEGHWVHTDWQPMNLVNLQVLAAEHVQFPAHGIDRREAGILMWRTEAFLNALCAQVPCPERLPSIGLEFDVVLVDYAAEKLPYSKLERLVQGPPVLLSYGLPSPLRVRWPSDGSPEPLVLASLCRHLAYDLVVGAAGQELDPADRAALTLSVVWLAHHLLDSPAVPTTRWLDEAAAVDGEAAVVDFLLALRDGAPWTEALSGSFSPEALASIMDSNDYYGWLTRVADPLGQTAPIYRRTGLWQGESFVFPVPKRVILEALDREVVAWAPAGQVYRKALPDVSHVVGDESSAMVTAELGQNWVAVYFLRQVEGNWTLLPFDQAISGEFLSGEDGPYSVTDGPVTIIYWAWDEPFLEELRQIIRTSHEQTVDAFQLPTAPATYALVPFEDPAGTPFEPPPGAVGLLSPAWLSIRAYPEPDYRTSTLHSVIWYLVQDRLRPFDELHGWGLYLQIITSHRVMVSHELGIEDPAAGRYLGEGWHPPAAVDDPGWTPLSELWLSWLEFGQSDELELIACSRLMVDYILERQGREALPLMMEGLSTAHSMEEWIAAVTGQSLETFEPAWRGWVLQQELP